jgi:hypothetical protein
LLVCLGICAGKIFLAFVGEAKQLARLGGLLVDCAGRACKVRFAGFGSGFAGEIWQQEVERATSHSFAGFVGKSAFFAGPQPER